MQRKRPVTEFFFVSWASEEFKTNAVYCQMHLMYRDKCFPWQPIHVLGVTSCRRAAATICPHPSPPPWPPKRLAPPSRRQRSSSFPRPTHSHAHRCSRLTRQHGGEQCGRVTLTLKVVSESHVTWAISVPILVFLGLSVLDLGSMYATDRQTSDVRQTDVRQHHRLMPPPSRRGIIRLLMAKNAVEKRPVNKWELQKLE